MYSMEGGFFMPSVNMICPHCKAAVRKSLMFNRDGKASRGSGICSKCHKPIVWWGENNRAKIAKG